MKNRCVFLKKLRKDKRALPRKTAQDRARSRKIAGNGSQGLRPSHICSPPGGKAPEGTRSPPAAAADKVKNLFPY